MKGKDRFNNGLPRGKTFDLTKVTGTKSWLPQSQSGVRQTGLGARRRHALEADLLPVRHRSRDGASALAGTRSA